MRKYLSKAKNRIIHYKVLVQNFSYLALIQVVNLLVILASYPYLIKVLGKETFGLVIFAQTFVSYFVVLVSFGFNISATKEISIFRDDRAKVNEIFSSILIIKGTLFLVSFIGLIVAFNFFETARTYKLLFLFSMFGCLYEFIFPIWFFLGVEKMKDVTIISFISKSIFFILIFLFIKSKSDYLYVPLFSGIGSLIAGLYSVYKVIKNEKVEFTFQSIKTLKHYFKESITFFISNLSSHIYSNANKLVIGTFLGMTQVAYFDLAEKIILMLKLPQAVFSQAVFPRITKDLNRKLIKNLFVLSFLGNSLLYVFVLLFAPFLVYILGSKEMVESINVLNTLAITVLINGVSNFCIIQILTAFGYKNIVSRIIFTSLFLYIISILLLYIFNMITLHSVSIVTIMIELNTTLMTLYYIKQKNIFSKGYQPISVG